MNPQEHEEARRIFFAVCNLDPEERARALDRECAGRPILRALVEQMLREDVELAHFLESETSDSFLENVPVGGGDSPPTVPLENTPPRPDWIGPYRILQVIGEGGMGIVYLAEQTEPIRRRVALKVVKHGLGSEEVIARFEFERQALALMSHPSIAAVYDAGTTSDGRPYFAMEHVQGVPITEYCDRNRLSTRERLDLFVQVCDAVQHAHQKAIIHRDIKPSNVLVTIQGDKPLPKVIDFGVAKATNQRLTEKTYFTEHGRIIGTPAYMSPEQAEMTAQDIDTRTDIYSLGVLLYELLVGTLPFDTAELLRAGYAGIQRMIREQDPLRPSTRLSGLGDDSAVLAKKRHTHVRSLIRELRGDLDWITMKALEKDRTRRYATAHELAADVLRHLRHEPVLAGPPDLIYRFKKLVRKYPSYFIGTAACLLFVAALLGQSWYRDAQEREAAVRESRRLRAEAETAVDEFRRASSSLRAVRRELSRVEEEYETWQPVWERADELELRRDLSRLQEQVDGRYNTVLSSLLTAQRVAPPDSAELVDVRRAIAEFFLEQLRGVQGDVPLGGTSRFFESMVRAQGLPEYEEKIRPHGFVRFRSTPAGADVYCFRFREDDDRLLPLPFRPGAGGEDPAGGFVGEPSLIVSGVWETHSGPFELGDRWLEVDGEAVSRRGDVARALEDVVADESVQVKVDRAGTTRVVDWIPFPAPPKEEEGAASAGFQPGRVVDFYAQFGLTFAGYPLDLTPDCRVGRTSDTSPLEVDLFRGSYLFVFAREGYATARLPLDFDGQERVASVRLLRADAVPEGFVHVPAGSFPCGGDPDAYESLDPATPDVADFLMARFEVTIEEYLPFVNDAAVLARIDATSGKAVPELDWEDETLAAFKPAEVGPVQFVPYHAYSKRLLLKLEGEPARWVLADESYGRLPVLGVSMLAGVEYAGWRSRSGGPDSRWRYRLPRELEWEKAARGADRRPYVWGSRLYLSFCDCAKGSFGPRGKSPGHVGVFPFDESVYGIRDLGGSVSEATLDQALEGYRFFVSRGGNWDTFDLRDYRAATRNHRRPEDAFPHIGLRLVAEPTLGSKGAP